MSIDINKLTLEEILELKEQLSRVRVGEFVGRTSDGNRPKHDYAAWDWSKTAAELMAEHKVSRATVSVWRRQLGHGSVRSSSVMEERRRKWESWDWTKTNQELAAEHGLSPQSVGVRRYQLGKPKATKWSARAKTWDWSKSNAEIARENKVDLTIVIGWRHKLGMPPGPRDPSGVSFKGVEIPPAPTVEHSSWDWTKPDVVIAREVGLSRERVRQIRAKLGLPKVTVASIKYKQFLEKLGDRKELEMRDHAEFGLSRSGFQRYCAKAGVELKWTPCGYGSRKYPMREMNWDLPSVLLKEIWKVPDRHISAWRYNHGLPKSKFWCRAGKYPSRYTHLVWQERQKAEKYFEAKQQAAAPCANGAVEPPSVASDNLAS